MPERNKKKWRTCSTFVKWVEGMKKSCAGGEKVEKKLRKSFKKSRKKLKKQVKKKVEKKLRKKLRRKLKKGGKNEKVRKS